MPILSKNVGQSTDDCHYNIGLKFLTIPVMQKFLPDFLQKSKIMTETDAITKPKTLQNRILNGIIVFKGVVAWKISESNLKVSVGRAE